MSDIGKYAQVLERRGGGHEHRADSPIDCYQCGAPMEPWSIIEATDEEGGGFKFLPDECAKCGAQFVGRVADVILATGDAWYAK